MNPDPPTGFNDERYAAIVFDASSDPVPQPYTSGNLVAGAHLAFSRARVHDESGAWNEESGPITGAGPNLNPPEFTDYGWSNRIHWYTGNLGSDDGRPGSCYHLTITDPEG